MAKVMIVDDEADIVETLKTIMESGGYETCTASDGKECIKNLSSCKPDLILLDVMMPGQALPETLDLIEKKGPYKVILVTVVRFMEEEKNEYLGKPFVVDYITKPFNFSDVLKRVQQALG